MKTSKLIPALFVSSLMGLAACTPRDVKVGTDDQRAKIRQLNNKGNGKANQKNANEFSLSNYSLSSFLMEKQIEAVELVKVAISGDTEARKTQYVVEAGQDREDGAKTAKITSVYQGYTYQSNDAAWVAKASKSINVVYTMKDGLLESLSATGANVNSTVDNPDAKKTYVNLEEETYAVKATSVDAANLKIELKSAGQISGSKGGKNVPNAVTIAVTVVVDKASLLTSDVKIVSMDAAMTYPGFNGKTFNSNLKGGALALNLNGMCNKLVGTVDASAGPKNQYKVTFAEDSITIKGWVKDLATCGKRPTVDISRLQVP
ncbi:hypothetical protein [Bdellovibrio sp. NC01]|uniref:hypothetical protein n=1 Tax=Bdellovibrio sp. NC01 TaxID=2220073 RepID=UPI00115A6F09|nr:hypothetical protein [Bdellovibrio sp. NC01]QDK38246.1 hypothetical protein DOE51_11975 [Bdellovibrio sp. NC01]